jgi:hypothetical protein
MDLGRSRPRDCGWKNQEIAGGRAARDQATVLGREQDGAVRRAGGGHEACRELIAHRHQVLLTSFGVCRGSLGFVRNRTSRPGGSGVRAATLSAYGSNPPGQTGSGAAMKPDCRASAPGSTTATPMRPATSIPLADAFLALSDDGAPAGRRSLPRALAATVAAVVLALGLPLGSRVLPKAHPVAALSPKTAFAADDAE